MRLSRQPSTNSVHRLPYEKRFPPAVRASVIPPWRLSRLYDTLRPSTFACEPCTLESPVQSSSTPSWYSDWPASSSNTGERKDRLSRLYLCMPMTVPFSSLRWRPLYRSVGVLRNEGAQHPQRQDPRDDLSAKRAGARAPVSRGLLPSWPRARAGGFARASTPDRPAHTHTRRTTPSIPCYASCPELFWRRGAQRVLGNSMRAFRIASNFFLFSSPELTARESVLPTRFRAKKLYPG